MMPMLRSLSSMDTWPGACRLQRGQNNRREAPHLPHRNPFRVAQVKIRPLGVRRGSVEAEPGGEHGRMVPAASNPGTEGRTSSIRAVYTGNGSKRLAISVKGW